MVTLCDIHKMHKILFSAVVLLLCAIPGISSRAQEKSEADQLRSLEIEVTNLYQQRKIEQIAPLLDDDFVITF